MPGFPDQQSTEEGTSVGFEVFCGIRGMGGASDSSNLWMDEDARSFYESLPDLKASMPGVSLFDVLIINLNKLVHKCHNYIISIIFRYYLIRMRDLQSCLFLRI